VEIVGGVNLFVSDRNCLVNLSIAAEVMKKVAQVDFPCIGEHRDTENGNQR